MTLAGKKTYITGIASIIGGIILWLTGSDLGPVLIVQGATAITGRQAITKVTQKTEQALGAANTVLAKVKEATDQPVEPDDSRRGF